MEYFTSLLRAFIVLVALIGSAFWLRHRKVLATEHNVLFSKLITEFSLPALVFISLSRHSLSPQYWLQTGIMGSVLIVCLGLAWLIGHFILRLNPGQLGAFILVSGFGSSSSLGYTIVAQALPGNVSALSDAVVCSEFGTAIPVFTLGVLIAMYYGRRANPHATHVSFGDSFNAFVRSPLFFSLLLGIAASFLPTLFSFTKIPTVEDIFTIIGKSLEIFVGFSIALMLRKISWKILLPAIVAAVLLKLIGEPLITLLCADLLHINHTGTMVLLLESGMPSGVIAAVIAGRYHCDHGFGSALVIATYLCCLVTLPLLSYFLT